MRTSLRELKPWRLQNPPPLLNTQKLWTSRAISQRIRVRHPGYKAQNTLFTFPASDGKHRGYAHYATVWVACFIFTNGEDDLWLSTSLEEEPRISGDTNGLIPAGDYYLHVPRNDPQLTDTVPIVPNFRAWRFPHGSLPALWLQASQNAELLAQQTNFSLETIAIEHCRITNRQLEVDNAHIIPVSEKLWFTSNGMEEYGDLSGRSGEVIAVTLSNRIRLRCDAHRLWDKLNFSIVPREGDAPNDGAAWVTQAMSDGEELHEHWHGQRLQSLAGRPPQYLLARFAWDIFPKLHAFLQAGQKRRLIVCGADGIIETRKYGEKDCRQFTVGQGRGRSASPTKRARSEASGCAEDLEPIQRREDPIMFSSSLLGFGRRPCPDSADSAVAGIHKPANSVFENDEVKSVFVKCESEWSRICVVMTSWSRFAGESVLGAEQTNFQTSSSGQVLRAMTTMHLLTHRYCPVTHPILLFMYA